MCKQEGMGQRSEDRSWRIEESEDRRKPEDTGPGGSHNPACESRIPHFPGTKVPTGGTSASSAQTC